jgi:predicted neutral ceramidase superfamily lipid hydrolase
MAAEDKKERVNRELIELLNELRVALPGVQVLFAFLLTVPFAQRFGAVSDLQRAVYFVALISTAVASVLFITPTAYHRLRWREPDKEGMLFTANRLAIAGTVFLAVAMAAVVFLIADVIYGGWQAAVTAGGVAGLLAWFWYGLPLSRRAEVAAKRR